MKKTERVFKEILFQALEQRQYTRTQANLARTLGISLSTVNAAIRTLEHMGAVEVQTRSFHIIDSKKILYYWASIRNLSKDIIYTTRVPLPVREVEKMMPSNVQFTAYSGYKFLYNDVPADYSEVYVYGDEKVEKRFPQNAGPANLFVLKIDGSMTIAQLFVDLWNIKEWYAKYFLEALEVKLHGVLE